MKKNCYDKEDILKCGKGELFSGRIKLPIDEMLMIDRILSITEAGGKYGKGQIIAEFDINPEQWFFKCHFKDDPVMPGCLGLDALWQLTGFYLGWVGLEGAGRALGVSDVKFKKAILPTTKKITYKIDIKKITNRRLKIGLSDGSIEIDNKVIYEAKNLKVGLF